MEIVGMKMNAIDQLNAIEAKIEAIGDKLESDPTNQALMIELTALLAAHGAILGQALREADKINPAQSAQQRRLWE
jgi:hypothetical protein